MERHFERELGALRERLLVMGGLAETMIHKGIAALVERDESLVQAVLAHEEEMDLLCIEVDDRCFTRLALQQPMASDLRFLVASIKINSDLERMADQAVSIALRAQSLITQPEVKPLIDIPRMAQLAREMLRAVLRAFVERDIDTAKAIAARDDEMDQLYRAVFDELVEIMAGKPGTAARATYLLWCAHSLERIADHVTNIAERLVFLRTGDMRELNV